MRQIVIPESLSGKNSSGLLMTFKYVRSGLPSKRKNLSPFTKDFRGGGQLDEPIGNFLHAQQRAGLLNEQSKLGARKQ